ncbi:unnamed protein product [Gongylonema pulchrum]|uniref:AcetylCoA_hydro domain-containing protein n=1 Tax=Gongylonema pulchrum TaxID=637853 RepID=A0A183EA10_9BILA|nr:unnamed protein product [Gongylonema pulchrum]
MHLLSRFSTVPLRTLHSSAALLRLVPGSLESDHIFVHGIAATPTPLLEGLCDYAVANDLKKLTLHHLHLEGPTKWTEPAYRDRIRSNSLFTGSNLRKAVNEGIADFNSTFLHEVPLLFRTGAIKLNVAMLTVSPPDAFGFCTLGTSVDAARAAVTQADHIIGLFAYSFDTNT